MNGKSARQQSDEDTYAADLLLRVARQDRLAMERLYGLFQDALYRVALIRTGSPSTAAQLLQRLMLGIWAGAQARNTTQRPRIALLRLAALAAAKHLAAAPEELDPSTAELLPAITASGMAENLHTALGRLPERYRTVLHLAYFECLPDAEIAQVLDYPEDAVNWHRRQGRDALSRLARGPGDSLDPRARDLFLDTWIRRELRVPPDPSPCDFGLDMLNTAIGEADRRRARLRFKRRWLRRPLARLLRGFGVCSWSSPARSTAG